MGKLELTKVHSRSFQRYHHLVTLPPHTHWSWLWGLWSPLSFLLIFTLFRGRYIQLGVGMAACEQMFCCQSGPCWVGHSVNTLRGWWLCLLQECLSLMGQRGQGHMPLCLSSLFSVLFSEECVWLWEPTARLVGSNWLCRGIISGPSLFEGHCQGCCKLRHA